MSRNYTVEKVLGGHRTTIHCDLGGEGATTVITTRFGQTRGVTHFEVPGPDQHQRLSPRQIDEALASLPHITRVN